MKRFAMLATLVAMSVLGWAGVAQAAPQKTYTAGKAVKINVMGEWAHPDDDTSIIGPCGVWRQRYGIRCGLIMITRGEGGGNAVGSETGPALGLRRENEDRIAHYRSGTVDIFNLDRVDFFYNQSAPLTQEFWGHDETLERIVRIIRMTQPDIYLGFGPTIQGVGHGNHQQAGRFIWEGMKAAADPNMFPEQLTGPGALSTWQVKKVFSGGSTAGTGGNPNAADCTTGFTPAATNLDNVVGVWTGYQSPYRWPEGNIAGAPAGSQKIWEQIHVEGTAAYPTQSRVMRQDAVAPTCRRFGMTASFVPFQPLNSTTQSAAGGKDEAMFYGASIRDPGGFPLGTLEYLTTSDFYNAPGAPFEVTFHGKSGFGTIGAGTVKLNVPTGWTVDGPAGGKPVGATTPDGPEQTVTFTVTPAANATVNQNYPISALWTSGNSSGYTDQVVRVVSPVEGRFERWGNWAEVDEWMEDVAPEARRLGRSLAQQSIGVGETLELPVVVHNWSTTPQSGNVTLTLPAGVTADSATKSYGTLAPGAETTVEFAVSNSFTNATLPTGQNVTVGIATSYDQPAPGTGSENLTLTIVPKTGIQTAAGAPTVDGQEGAEYAGAERLDIGRVWQGAGNCATAADCGRSDMGGGDTNYAKVVQHGDNLYFFAHIRDDFQSYAVKPEECVGHWQADSVEFLIDPRGNASQRLKDTADTFKLAVFPYTNDPQNTNGNGVNGPCWSRDADNHQGYSTGPLAATVDGAPNAPGVQVASTATWVGTNETTTDHAYAGGGYDLEVKIPIAALPSRPDPDRMGLNVTPYDNDNTAATGTTTLRHIDQSTRLGWSALGSVQSDPYRWGRATLPGYTPPASMPTEAPAPNVSHPNLDGVNSPQTIANSAHSGVPISGRTPAPANDSISITGTRLGAAAAEMDVVATGPGTARVFLWSGNEGYVPVWTTSCSPQEDPAPDYGFTACAPSDGGIPPWGTDMSGHVVKSLTVQVTGAGTQRVSIALTPEERAKLARDGSALVSFATPNDEVQAFDLPLAQVRSTVTSSPTSENGETDLRAEFAGNTPFPGLPTGTATFKVGDTTLGSAPLENGAATLTVPTSAVQDQPITVVYSGDGDYLPRTATKESVRGPAGVPGPPGPQGPPGPPASLATGRARLASDTVDLDGRRVQVRVRCPSGAQAACKGTATIRLRTKLGGRRYTIGAKAFTVRAGRSRTLTVVVPKRVARRMDGRTVQATVTISWRNKAGTIKRSSSRLTIEG